MENSKLRATPAARDLAKMMGIDLLMLEAVELKVEFIKKMWKNLILRKK